MAHNRFSWHGISAVTVHALRRTYVYIAVYTTPSRENGWTTAWVIQLPGSERSGPLLPLSSRASTGREIVQRVGFPLPPETEQDATLVLSIGTTKMRVKRRE